MCDKDVLSDLGCAIHHVTLATGDDSFSVVELIGDLTNTEVLIENAILDLGVKIAKITEDNEKTSDFGLSDQQLSDLKRANATIEELAKSIDIFRRVIGGMQCAAETHENGDAMAICGICNKPMKAGAGCCTSVFITEDGAERPAIKYGDEKGHEEFEDRCYGCGCAIGEYHHMGCEVEQCPICGFQAIYCGCKREYRG